MKEFISIVGIGYVRMSRIDIVEEVRGRGDKIDSYGVPIIINGAKWWTEGMAMWDAMTERDRIIKEIENKEM